MISCTLVNDFVSSLVTRILYSTKKTATILYLLNPKFVVIFNKDYYYYYGY